MSPEQQFLFTLAAIVIAGVSLLVSAISLGWNIYRDVVLKARLRLRFSLSELHHPTFEKPPTTLVLSGTNLGPGQIKCSLIQLKAAPLWRRILRRVKHAIMIHDYENPLSGQLPVKLDVGEGVDLLIRYTEDCFLSEHWTHIGLSDSFGRVHWASVAEVAAARRNYRRDFPKADSKPADPS